MNLQKCKNGHFYDGDLYPSCPHCGQSPEPNKTMALVMPSGNDDEDVTLALSTEPVTVPKSAERVKSLSTEDGEKTVGIVGQGDKEELTPTVGWLVCMSGRFYGRDFRLKTGRNFIGRSRSMDICLEGETSVSRERHATIIYEPRQNIFLAQPGDSRELFYLNDKVVLSATALKKNDILQVGEVSLMLIPCCDENFNWSEQEKKEEKK